MRTGLSLARAREIGRMPVGTAARLVAAKARAAYRRVEPYLPVILGGLVGMPLMVVMDPAAGEAKPPIKFGSLTLSEADADKILILKVTSESGYHALPGVRLAAEAGKFKSAIRIHKPDGNSGDIKSFMDVALMIIEQGDTVVITFEGEDAAAARGAIEAKLVELYNAGGEKSELGPLLSWIDLVKELSPPAAPAPPPPVSAKTETLPAGFLRGETGNINRIVEAEVVVVNNREVIERSKHTPPSADEAERFSEAVAVVSRELERSSAATVEDSAVARNLRLLQEFSGAVLEIIRARNLGTAAAANAYFAQYQKVGKLVADMQALMEDVIMARYGLLSEILAQVDLARKGKVVLVLSTLTPLTALRVVENRGRVEGVICEKRLNRESHQIILLDDAEVPVVTGLPHITSQLQTGGKVMVDSGEGIVITDTSSEDALNYFKARLEEQTTLRKITRGRKSSAAITTKDGREIRLYVNAERRDELEGDWPGIGLYRSEFFWIKNPDGSMRDTAPPFPELVEEYAQLLRVCQGRPLVLRTFDFEPTKYPRYLDRRLILEGIELGPAGYLLYDETDKTQRFYWLDRLFRRQVRAFLLATGIVAQERSGDINPALMFPMIFDAAAFARADMVVDQEKRRLRRQGEPFFDGVRVGTMVELPSAAKDADILANRMADFMSIGTNDLKAATFVELGSRDADEVSRTIEGMPPKMLEYIVMTAAAGEKYKIPVSCCGVLASSPRYAPLLVGAGVTALSTTKAQSKIIAHLLEHMTYGDAKAIVEEALGLGTADEVDRLLDRRIKDYMLSGLWGELVGIRSLMLRDRTVAGIIAKGEAPAYFI